MQPISSIARTAISCGLGLSLALGCALAPAAIAQAEQGSLTITQLHNNDASYDAYLLFTADIDKHDQATHIAWSSPDVRTVVLDYLDQNGYGTWLSTRKLTAQHDVAQNAAEYCAQMIADSATATGTVTTPRTTAAQSFANGLARALAAGAVKPTATATAGTTFSGEEGYWLFVTGATSAQADSEAGTAPLWLPLGGSVTTIDEKTAVPTVTKQVREDSSGAWGSVADAHTGQVVDYRLTGTLPDNLATFDSYHYRLDDTLSSGLSIVTPTNGNLAEALTVKVGDHVVSIDDKNLTASIHDNTLTVEFANLLSEHWADLGIDKNSTITVEYQARLTPEAQYGSSGNANGVQLTYTNDPVQGGDGHTPDIPDMTKTFAYQLELLKVDETTSKPLSGAGFTLQVADDNRDEDSRGRYVQADGSLASQAHTFVTDKKGRILISGLDEGSYLVREVKKPTGYDSIGEDIALTITSTLDGATVRLTDLKATTGSDATGGEQGATTGVSKVDAASGTVTLTITNDKQISLPLTGLAGMGATAGAGAATAVVAGIVMVLRRQRGNRW